MTTCELANLSEWMGYYIFLSMMLLFMPPILSLLIAAGVSIRLLTLNVIRAIISLGLGFTVGLWSGANLSLYIFNIGYCNDDMEAEFILFYLAPILGFLAVTLIVWGISSFVYPAKRRYNS